MSQSHWLLESADQDYITRSAGNEINFEHFTLRLSLHVLNYIIKLKLQDIHSNSPPSGTVDNFGYWTINFRIKL